MLGRLNVGVRLALLIAISIGVASILAVAGVRGLSESKNVLQTVYEDRMVAVRDLSKIAALMLESRTYLRTALSDVKIVGTIKNQQSLELVDETADKSAVEIVKNISAMNALWSAYTGRKISTEEKLLSDKFVETKTAFVKKALKPALFSLRAHDYEKSKTLDGKANELYVAASKDIAALVNFQFDMADQAYHASIVRYENSRKMAIFALVGAILVLVVLGMLIVRTITKPLKEILGVFKSISAKRYDSKISVSGTDELGEVLIALDGMQTQLGVYANESQYAAKESQRASDEANRASTEMASVLRGLASGDLSKRVDGTYTGAYNTIKNDINSVNETLNELITEMNHMSLEHDAGDIDVMIASTKFQGAFKEMAEGVNDMVGDHIAVNKNAMATVKSFGEGDFSAPLERFPGKQVFINDTIEQVRKNLQAVIADVDLLSEAGVAGKLSTRVDANRHKGDFRKIVEEINSTLDAFINPLSVAAECVERISRGDIPPIITENYNGDFNTIKNNLNTCIKAINALVSDTNKLAQAASDGLVNTRADAHSHDGEFRKIVEGLNATLQTIVAPIVAVKESAEAINTAANEISSGNVILSQRIEDQASSLERAASNMDNLAHTVKQNAENAKLANQMATSASEVAIKGGVVVREVITTMSAINESSHKISEIISVIDGIAFQTNILALNAAVEAARAGEQGRGFAVVASEVRNLAQRSASAAKDIKGLIVDSVRKAEEGSKQVESAGSTMQEVVSSVQSVTTIMGEIATASAQQSTEIDQVNQSVTTMDEVTHKNAALVKEATAAAESLVEQAASLIETVSAFKLDEEESSSARKKSTNVAKAEFISAQQSSKLLQLPAKSVSKNSDWSEF